MAVVAAGVEGGEPVQGAMDDVPVGVVEAGDRQCRELGIAKPLPGLDRADGTLPRELDAPLRARRRRQPQERGQIAIDGLDQLAPGAATPAASTDSAIAARGNWRAPLPTGLARQPGDGRKERLIAASPPRASPGSKGILQPSTR
ncbi:MAG: hypothetical protein FJ293_14070 [Planctomycetes bacterium]|nr:hypothetical protein [Planctomycetota bacterium]